MARAQGARALTALAFQTVYGMPPMSGLAKMPFASTTLEPEGVGGHRNNVLDALPLAEKPRARDRRASVGADAALPAIAAVQVLAQPFHSPNRLEL